MHRHLLINCAAVIQLLSTDHKFLQNNLQQRNDQSPYFFQHQHGKNNGKHEEGRHTAMISAAGKKHHRKNDEKDQADHSASQGEDVEQPDAEIKGGAVIPVIAIIVPCCCIVVYTKKYI